MKYLYLIGGPMGVGKTTVCKALKTTLDRSVMLDGDWCWDMHPFTVTEETKSMVTDNIAHLLLSFIRCSEIDHVIFCWVMHEQAIIDDLLARLPLKNVRVILVSLVCSEAALIERLEKDIRTGLRAQDVIPRSLDRLAKYDALRTHKIDTTNIMPADAVKTIIALSE